MNLVPIIYLPQFNGGLKAEEDFEELNEINKREGVSTESFESNTLKHKVKCAEIYRYCDNENWEFICLCCSNTYSTVIDLFKHLRDNFTEGSCEKCCTNKLLPLGTIKKVEPINEEGNISDEANSTDLYKVSITEQNLSEKSEEFSLNKNVEKRRNSELETVSDNCDDNQEEMLKVENIDSTNEPNNLSEANKPQAASSCECDICNRIFPNKGAIRRHMTYHQQKRFECKYCDKQFRSIYQLRVHQRRHENKDETESAFQCDICTRRFKSENGLAHHLRKHEGDKKAYHCDRCEKSFTRSSTLKVHVQRDHFNQKPYQCSACGAFLASTSELATHMRRHCVDKPYKCDMCDASFVYPWKLKEHARRHTGEKPLQCPFCPKTFARNRLLKQHQNIHTGKLNYPCRHCDKQFTQAAGRRAHEKHVHKVA